MDLTNLRKEIDEIDDQMLDLFVRRMTIVEDVARYKIEHQLPVFNQSREQEILDRMKTKAGRSANNALVLFQTMMDISKSSQYREMIAARPPGALRRQIAAAIKNPPEIPSMPHLVCQGVEGSYSHGAALQMMPDAQISFAKDFESVFKAVKAGLFQFGVLPIENSSAGSVLEVYDLLKKYRLNICKSFKLPISHCLLAKKGVDFEQITQIFSHQQAISQCSDFLALNHKIAVHGYSNTAAAARLVSETTDSDCTIAAIASKECAELYGLNIISESIQNSEYNHTRFICVAKELIISEDADKISLELTVPHEPAALYRLMTRFAVNQLNLSKLESRPISGTDFEFMFYFDIDGSVRDQRVLDLICSLDEELDHFHFLGNYR